MINFFKQLFAPAPKPKHVISPDQHQIDFKKVDSNALSVLKGLHKHGHDAYLVGGVIRDLGSDVMTKDCDVVTSARPDKVNKCFKRSVCIGKRFRLVHVFFGRQYIEVSTFRANAKRGRVYTNNGMIKRDNVYGKIHDDVMRRDFTINALYMRYPEGEIIDYLGGWDDLQKKVLKSIGPAQERFLEDPIRILRAIRFKAKLSLRMEPEITDAIDTLKARLLDVPGQRLFVEVIKLYYSGYATEVNQLIWEMGIFEVLFPDVTKANQKLAKALIERMSIAADKRYKKQDKLSVAYLVATLYWVKCETAMREKRVKGFSAKLA
ncbi:polynucleotide adenylyltransferase PcnB, partial [Gammaproteobacteria bacterium]|nr:polynucleotide adenylyltransferase PcnB [Gammaproteobacteria bacterium]